MKKALLTVTAAIEVGTGVALLVWPPAPVQLLLGSSLDTPAALTVGRLAGAALLALGAACWLARSDKQSRTATGLITAMLLYNTAAVALLAFVGVSSGLRGVGLWPAVVLHAALAGWCVASLRPSAEAGARRPRDAS